MAESWALNATRANAPPSLLSARKCQRTFFCCASFATPHPTKQTCRPPIHLTFVYPFFRLVFPAFLNGNSQRRSCLCATVPFALVQKHKNEPHNSTALHKWLLVPLLPPSLPLSCSGHKVETRLRFHSSKINISGLKDKYMISTYIFLHFIISHKSSLTQTLFHWLMDEKELKCNTYWSTRIIQIKFKKVIIQFQ